LSGNHEYFWFPHLQNRFLAFFSVGKLDKSTPSMLVACLPVLPDPTSSLPIKQHVILGLQ
jgi:hypothetical protein